MAGIWAHALPAYLDKWGVRYILGKNWDKIGRSGDTGFDSVKGVICHHDAIGPGAGEDTWRSSIPPRWGGNRIDGPVGNGSLDHNGVFHFWAAGAANTAGKGGPLLSSRGVVALDSANRCTFNIEARNNGLGEQWPDVQLTAYVRLVAAVLDWANHETPGPALGVGDVWFHNTWAPTRKIDPATVGGAPRFAPQSTRSGTWNLDVFRGSVFQALMNPPGAKPVTPKGKTKMYRLITYLNDPQGAVWLSDFNTMKWIDQNAFASTIAWLEEAGFDATLHTVPNTDAALYGPVVAGGFPDNGPARDPWGVVPGA